MIFNQIIIATSRDSTSSFSTPYSSSPPSATSSPRPSSSRLLPAQVSPNTRPSLSDSEPLWIYLGSHALTPSAWGEWLPTSTWFTPALKIENFELGVLIPFRPIYQSELTGDSKRREEFRSAMRWRSPIESYDS